mmetsp:Transcript_31586/g.73519  ORF Transcript_31586/g.73519 Transcript_31586/m.73519 type:complete len:194 (-) Transcript_31586:1-582(-)
MGGWRGVSRGLLIAALVASLAFNCIALALHLTAEKPRRVPPEVQQLIEVERRAAGLVTQLSRFHNESDTARAELSTASMLGEVVETEHVSRPTAPTELSNEAVHGGVWWWVQVLVWAICSAVLGVLRALLLFAPCAFGSALWLTRYLRVSTRCAPTESNANAVRCIMNAARCIILTRQMVLPKILVVSCGGDW